MEKWLILFFIYSSTLNTSLLAQVCTISGSGTINWSAATCQEPGVNPTDANTDIIVPSAVNLNIPNSGGFSHSGDFIIYGTLTNNKANALINGSITIKSGANLVLNAKMDIGSAAGCGYSLIIENGGSMTLNGSGGSDLLSICGVKIAQSGGGCTNCDPPTCPLEPNKPYCEPTGGFTGPLGYDETGYNNTLPITLLYFRGQSADMSVSLEWATIYEENFDHFELERSIDGISFETLTEITGRGGIDIATRYSYGDNLETSGRYYYRLKSIDYDRSFEYSKIISVVVGSEQSIVIYPNPVIDRKLKIKGLSGSVQCILIDQLGRPLMSMELVHDQSEILIDQDISSGLYLLKVIGTGYSKMLKVQIL